MKKDEIKIKKTINVESFKAVMSDLVNSFKDGTICIQDGKNYIALKPANNIEIQIEAGKKKGKEKLLIEMNWHHVAEEAGENDFKITSSEPEIPAEPEDEDIEKEKEE